jgi:hypothetical protein
MLSRKKKAYWTRTWTSKMVEAQFSHIVLRYLDDSWWWGWANILGMYGSSFLNDTAQAVFSPSDQAAWSWTMEHHNWLAICYICVHRVTKWVVDLYTPCYAWPLHFLVMPGYILKARCGCSMEASSHWQQPNPWIWIRIWIRIQIKSRLVDQSVFYLDHDPNRWCWGLLPTIFWSR